MDKLSFKPYTIGELVVITHAVPPSSYVDFSGCVPAWPEADLCVRDFDVTELTFYKGLVFIIPHVTILVFKLVPLSVDKRGFVVKLRISLIQATISCHSLAYE